MKKIFCPMCGEEMKSQIENLVAHQSFTCGKLGCSMKVITIIAPTEKAARKAWDKSLIGRLRKWWHMYDADQHAQYFLNDCAVALLRHMFGGDV